MGNSLEHIGFPFTRDEYLQALSVIMPATEAEMIAAGLYDDPEVIGMAVADLDLMLLAAHSEDAAARVAAYRPGLAAEVRRLREDPAAFLAMMRTANQSGPLPG